MEKIAVLENEVEALMLEAELEARDIPHVLKNYHCSAYDGLFQFSHGWGHVEAPVERKDEILAILKNLRQADSQGRTKKK